MMGVVFLAIANDVRVVPDERIDVCPSRVRSTPELADATRIAVIAVENFIAQIEERMRACICEDCECEDCECEDCWDEGSEERKCKERIERLRLTAVVIEEWEDGGESTTIDQFTVGPDDVRNMVEGTIIRHLGVGNHYKEVKISLGVLDVPDDMLPEWDMDMTELWFATVVRHDWQEDVDKYL